MKTRLLELRDKSAGLADDWRQNESSTLYLLDHIERTIGGGIRRSKCRSARSLSSKIPAELLDGDLELGILTFDPEDERLISKVIFTDHLAFIRLPVIGSLRAGDFDH